MTATKTKIRKDEEMVEQMGIFFEQRGLTPIHGRVFAYLLLAEPSYKDFYEIQDFLKASKSAISNALKFLISKNRVKYITFSGDRRRYFQVDMTGWLKSTKKEIQQITTLTDLVQDVLDARTNSKNLDFNEELKTMIDFQTQLTRNLNQFVKKWNRENE